MCSINSEATGRILLFILSAAGLIQGLVWLILSVISVCIYEDVWSVIDYDGSLSECDLIVHWYLKKDVDSNRIINAKEFNIFMYVYVVISLIWVILSSAILRDAIHDKLRDSTAYIQFTWSGIAVSLTVVDIVFMSLLIYDLSTFLNHLPEEPWGPLNRKLFNVFWILIAVAARGFLFLIVNLYLAYLLVQYTIWGHYTPYFTGPSQAPIYAYDECRYANNERFPMGSTDMNPLARVRSNPATTNQQNIGIDNPSYAEQETALSSTTASIHTPRVHLRQNTGQTSTSASATLDSNWSFHTEGSEIPRSRLRQGQTSMSNNPVPSWSFPHNFTKNIDFPEIGNQGRTSSSPNIPPPRVPTPDYTPPSSPKRNLKPVLKSRSNYT